MSSTTLRTRLILVLAVVSHAAWAYAARAYAARAYTPAAFTSSVGRSVFIDIKSLHSTITLDVATAAANAVSELEFDQAERGHAIFDLVPALTSITIDGKATTAPEVESPNSETKFRVTADELSAGHHRMTISNPITQDLEFKNGQPRLGFWFNDLGDRGFLEQYLPSNMEYDSFKMDFDITLVGARSQALIFSNGTLTETGDNRFHISYPAYFTTSSPFVHITDSADFTFAKEDFASVDGRVIPVTIYGEHRTGFAGIMKLAMTTLTELEGDYGPFKHNSLTVYATESFDGGMEYCGATITDQWALAHEITHSYFGRGTMPADGNAGWIDEAIASWRDDGYLRTNAPGFSATKMAGHPTYTRQTDDAAYNQGQEFMAYVDGKLARKPGALKGFLRTLLDPNTGVVFSPMQTQEFQTRLESYLGQSMQTDFDRLIYGKGQTVGAGANRAYSVELDPRPAPLSARKSPHRLLTADERRSLL